MFKVLFKTRLQSLFSSMFGRMLRPRSGQKASRGRQALVVLLAVYVVGMLLFSLGAYFKMSASTFHQMGLDWLYFAVAAMGSFMLCFVGSIFITQSQLFSARDNELLLSMPIRPGYILLSRMLTLLALNYIYSLLFMLPALIVYIMDVGLTASAALGAVLGTLALPFMSLALSSVCGWLIGLVSSHIKRSRLVTIVLLIGVFAAYMVFCMNLGRYMTLLMQNGAAIGDAVARALPPFYWFGQAATGDMRSLLLFLLCCAVPFALVYWVIARSYLRILTTKKGSIRVKYTEKAMKRRGIRAALLRREGQRFFGLTIYVFNSGIGAVMHLIMAVALVWKGPGLIQSLLNVPGAIDGAAGLLPGLATLCICFCTLMVTPSAASISLEGKSLWILRAAPVASIQVLRAKAELSILCSLPSGVLTSLACIVILPMTPLGAAGLLLAPMSLSLFLALFGLVANLLLPRLDWISEAVVVKQSASMMVAIFGGMAIVALPVALYALALHSLIALDLYVLLCAALFLLAALGLYGYLKTRGVQRFEAL